MANRWENKWQTLFSWVPKSLQMVTAAMKLKDACSLEEKLWPPRQDIKEPGTLLCWQSYIFLYSQKLYICIVKAIYFFPVVMYRCESWTIKKTEHRRTDAFELWCWRRLLKSPLDCKEIKPVHPKGNQSWIFIARTDAEAKAPILWPPDAKNWLTGKNFDAGKDRR